MCVCVKHFLMRRCVCVARARYLLYIFLFSFNSIDFEAIAWETHDAIAAICSTHYCKKASKLIEQEREIERESNILRLLRMQSL